MDKKSNPQVWKVILNGKIERIIIFYLILSIMFLIGLFEGGWINFEDGTKNVESDGFIGLMIFLFVLLGMPLLLATFSQLIKSKVPVKIEIDSNAHELILFFSKKNSTKLRFDDLLFSYCEKVSHNCLTIYKTFVGTRGQIVTKKMTILIGLPMTLSWKKQQLKEIETAFQELEIPVIDDEHKHLPLWERLISN